MHRISTISDQRHKRRLCPFVAGCNKYSSLCKTSSSGLSAPGKTRLDRERAKMCIAEIVSGIKKDSSQLPWRSERFVSLRPTFSVRGGHPKMTSVKFSRFDTPASPSHDLVLFYGIKSTQPTSSCLLLAMGLAPPNGHHLWMVLNESMIDKLTYANRTLFRRTFARRRGRTRTPRRSRRGSGTSWRSASTSGSRGSSTM